MLGENHYVYLDRLEPVLPSPHTQYEQHWSSNYVNLYNKYSHHLFKNLHPICGVKPFSHAPIEDVILCKDRQELNYHFWQYLTGAWLVYLQLLRSTRLPPIGTQHTWGVNLGEMLPSLFIKLSSAGKILANITRIRCTNAWLTCGWVHN